MSGERCRVLDGLGLEGYNGGGGGCVPHRVRGLRVGDNQDWGTNSSRSQEQSRSKQDSQKYCKVVFVIISSYLMMGEKEAAQPDRFRPGSTFMLYSIYPSPCPSIPISQFPVYAPRTLRPHLNLPFPSHDMMHP